MLQNSKKEKVYQKRNKSAIFQQDKCAKKEESPCHPIARSDTSQKIRKSSKRQKRRFVLKSGKIFGRYHNNTKKFSPLWYNRTSAVVQKFQRSGNKVPAQWYRKPAAAEIFWHCSSFCQRQFSHLP